MQEGPQTGNGLEVEGHTSAPIVSIPKKIEKLLNLKKTGFVWTQIRIINF